ncbi:MAG: hypothetical protein PHW33_00145 [Candidatus Portnoybacteria bacterium]|jgi:hypothetical protein|nr:hypothetical protein [Candidatus Portnoybacteria bacterium]
MKSFQDVNVGVAALLFLITSISFGGVSLLIGWWFRKITKKGEK